MKIRIGAAALLALVTLTACSSSTNGTGRPGNGANSSTPTSTGAGSTTESDSGSGSAPATGTTDSGGTSSEFCTKLEQAQTKLGDIGTSMSDPSKAKEVLTEEAAVFSDLEQDAPSDIKPAIHDLATVIAAAADYFENPGSGSTGALQDLTTKLPEDIQKLTTYVAANCR